MEGENKYDISAILDQEHGCIHQWFEIKKIEQHVCEEKHETIKIRCVNYRYGVLVQCANCLKTKELYGEETTD